MKKIDLKELTKKLNEFISKKENSNKTFTGQELHDALVGLGFSNGIVYKITNKFFPYEQVGKGRLYEMPKQPIYIGLISSVYKNQSKRVTEGLKKRKEVTLQNQSEEAALALLTSKGYQIRKCVGFDLEKFQKDNPILYRKYLKYEII